MKIIGDFPVCAICNKPVDLVKRYDDRINHQICYEISCHGDKEVVKIDYWDLDRTKVLIVDKAFITKRLEDVH